MRIALLNPTFLMRRPIAELAKLLADAGHEVTVVWPMDKSKATTNQLHFDKLLKDAPNIRVIPIWSKEIGAILWSYPTDIATLPKLIKVGRSVDVVQIWAPFYIMPLLPFVLKRLGLFRAKIIGTYDTVPSYSFSMGRITDKIFRAFFFLLTKPVLQAAKVTTLYSELLVPFAKRAGFSAKRLRVVPTGVHIKVRPQDGDIRTEFGLAKDLPIILFIGLTNKRKGVFKLLDMAESLKKEGRRFVLLAVGKGPEQEAFEAAIAERGLGDVVRALGRRQDVHNFYHQAAAFVLPAEGEGLPGVIMEALSYGVPVVASDIPCIPDLVQDGKNGFLVAPSDVAGFTKSLASLLDDKKGRDAMAKEAAASMQPWEWKKRMAEWEAVYEEAVR